MKKIIPLLMCAAVLIMTMAGCAKKEPNIVFTGTIEEVSDSSILVTTADDVGFDKASVSFAPDVKIAFNFLKGQVVKLTILPEIRESYPVQVTAVAIELVSEPASPDPTRADYTASFFRADSQADGGFDVITALAVNADMLIISSVRHIPVIVIDSAGALADFISAAKDYYQFDVAYDDNASFTENAAKYDDAFFNDNKLLILCTQETSGSIRHEIKDTVISGDTLSVEVEALVPEVGTDDMADWFILLEVPRVELDGVSTYDAYYTNS
jgi:hypothetical protein